MTPCQTFIAYRLPDDLGPCVMAAAWRAFDWRMALSPHDALLVASALAAVVAFGVVALSGVGAVVLSANGRGQR